MKTISRTIVHTEDGQERVSSSDLLTYVLRIPEGQQDRRHTMQLSDVMKHLGWQRADGNKITINGKQVRGYFRPLVPHQQALPLGKPKGG